MHPESIQGEESVLVDGLLQNGTDRAASRRAHLRESTMARQAAERRLSRTGLTAGMDDPARAMERAAAFRVESARIDAKNRAWMLEHGVVVVDRYVHRRKSSGITPQ
jgi:ABC-type branched-subunit amino acid transport system ATPase component